MIMSGAISLPRRRDQFKDAARRRGSYHDAFNKENSPTTPADNKPNNDVFSEDKVTPIIIVLTIHSNIQFLQLLLLFVNKDLNLTNLSPGTQ